MEIVLVKDTEINGTVFKRKSRVKVINSIGRKLVSERKAREYPNIFDRIELKLNKVLNTKTKVEEK
jgi:hypothetical protein